MRVGLCSCHGIRIGLLHRKTVALVSASLRRASKAATVFSGIQSDEEIEKNNYSDSPVYPDVIPPVGFKGVERLRYENRLLADKLLRLQTVPEKLAEVNPYERPWSDAERRWHRPWHQPLMVPRGAWEVPIIPPAYNLLPFYQFITKTHVVDQLPPAYEKIDVDSKFQHFKDSVEQRWQLEMSRDLSSVASEKGKWNEEDFAAGLMIEAMHNAVNQLFTEHHNQHVTWQNPLESFWIRGGFKELYSPYQPEIIEGWLPETRDKPARLIGDGRTLDGELVFSLKGSPALQVRSEWPLTPFAPHQGGLAESTIDKYIFDPSTLGLKSTSTPLMMRPGFEYGDENEFTSLISIPMSQVGHTVRRWNGDSQDLSDSFLSAGIMTGFSSLCATAHYLGFTQFTDLTYPLTTQVILTDGDTWELICYQLNSVAISHDWEESERPTNICWRSKPQRMFESFDVTTGKFTGFNDELLKLCLKMLLNEPLPVEESASLRPFVDLSLGRPLPVVLENFQRKRRCSGPTQYNLKYWYKDPEALFGPKE